MTTDTKAVARWDWDLARQRMDTFDDGRYVRFTDHERVVGELEERAVNMKSWARHDREMIEVLETELETLHTALAASRAEVEGLRAKAARYDWIRMNAVLDGANGDQLDAEIDAAMENGNDPSEA